MAAVSILPTLPHKCTKIKHFCKEQTKNPITIQEQYFGLLKMKNKVTTTCVPIIVYEKAALKSRAA